MLKFGIIGCGDVAFRTYFPGIDGIADRATVAVCFDPIAERAERAAARFPGARAVTSLEALLATKGLDGLFNLTPAPLHLATTGAALDAGFNVFSEKPLAGSVADGQALIAKAKANGLLLYCAPAVMATGRFRWLQKLIASGKLGRPLSATAQQANMGPAEWRAYTGDPTVFYKPGVGPLIDIGVYPLHAMTGLIGPVKRLQAFGGISIPRRMVTIERLAGQQIEVETPDQLLIHLDFGEARFGQLFASFAVPRSKAPAFELHGSGGSISISQEDWYSGNGATDVFLRDETPIGAAGWMNGVPLPDFPGPENLIGAGPRHFAESLLGQTQPILTADHACHVLEIMLTAYRSIREGRAIDLETTF